MKVGGEEKIYKLKQVFHKTSFHTIFIIGMNVKSPIIMGHILKQYFFVLPSAGWTLSATCLT